MSRKTTVYLPDQLKADVEREALRRGCSEAQVIRDAIEATVSRPQPQAGIIEGATIAEQAEVLLAGFGDR